MKINKHKESQSLNIIIQACGLLVVTLGLSAILGWIFDLTQLASFDPSKIPMALSSAVLFVMYGFIIFFHFRLPSNRFASWISIAFSSVGTLVTLLLLYLSFNGIRPSVEHLGIKMNGVVDGLIVGHMSPVTAVCFLLVGLSVLIMVSKTEQRKRTKISLIFAALVLLISIIFLLSYLFGAPLLYGGSFIPPALTASIAFLFLGIALLLMSGLKVWSYKKLSDVMNERYTYILALVFIILLVGVITAGYSYYKSYERQYRSEIENQLSAIAELKVSELVHWRKERLGDAEIFYRNPNFSILIEKYFRNVNDLQSIKNIQIWMDHLLAAYRYDRLCFHDSKGKERLNFTNTPGLHSSKFNNSILEAVESGNITFEDFHSNEHNNRTYLNISVPIFNTENKKSVIGIIAMRIDPEQYLYPLINKWPTPSKTAEILLLRREGNDALYLNELRFKKNTTLSLRIPLIEERVAAVQAVLGKRGIIEGVDYRGVPVIAYTRPIPNSPWFLVARMDISEVYAPLRERFWGIIILVVLLLIGSGASMGLVWWKQRSKFNHERYESNENIRKLNRVYAVLSDVNEAIVRIRNPQELFEKVCDISIEKGGFQMAWIGKINTQTKKVEVVASKGISKVHFQKIDFNYDADESILGITGQSIKNGVRVISNDIQNDNILLPFQNNSVLFGCKSLGAFSLKVFGNVWGVFKLYSTETGFFDEEELKLLDELVRDISFAIEFASQDIERIKSEEKLKKLSSAVEQTLDSILITDRDGTIEYVNNAFEHLTGFSSEEVLGKTPRILKSGKRDHKYYEEMWETILSGKVFSAEVINKKKNGDLYYEQKTISPIFDKNKNITHFVGTGVDISERKRSEEALLESETLFRSLFENMLNGFAYCRMIYENECPQDFIYLAVNNSFEMLTGLKDVIGKKVSEVIPGIRKSDPVLFEIYGRVASTGKPETIEIYVEGLKMWFSISVYSNKKEHFVAVFDVITERKLAEEVLRQSEVKFRKLIGSLPDPVFVIDTRGRIIYCNNNALKVFYYNIDEMLNLTMENLIPKHFREHHVALRNKFMSDPASRPMGKGNELFAQRKNGSEFPTEIMLEPVEINNNHFILAIVRDITERKRSEMELIDSKEKAESASKLKDAFIANMSHEIRTPLNGVLGMTSIIRDSYYDIIKEEDQELFTGIDFSCQRIIRTVDMILNYSRLQVGEFPVIRKNIVLSTICKNLVTEFAIAAGAKYLDLSFQNNCGDATIFADQYSITMAISNLIDNAIKYTKKGFIKVILYKDKNDEIMIDITDTGIGIAQGYLEKIFEPYRQEHMGYGRAYEGVGLGLSLVMKIVALNSAKILVESKKGEGTTFSINFGKEVQPDEKLAKTNIIIKTLLLPENSGIKVILLVEDDLMNQKTIKRFLENYYSIIITDSSDRALEILKKKNVDLILMDISILGGKNGLELTKEIKASKTFSHIPVIAITAHAFEADKVNALEAGCDNYLAKPFSKESILNMIEINLETDRIEVLN